VEPMSPVSPDVYVGPAPYRFRWWADLAPVALGCLVTLIFPDVSILAVLSAMVIVWFVYWLAMTVRTRRARAHPAGSRLAGRGAQQP